MTPACFPGDIWIEPVQRLGFHKCFLSFYSHLIHLSAYMVQGKQQEDRQALWIPENTLFSNFLPLLLSLDPRASSPRDQKHTPRPLPFPSEHSWVDY